MTDELERDLRGHVEAKQRQRRYVLEHEQAHKLPAGPFGASIPERFVRHPGRRVRLMGGGRR
jgi:hypothetical protein